MEKSLYWWWDEVFTDTDLKAIFDITKDAPFEEGMAGGKLDKNLRVANIKWIHNLSLKNILINRFHSANRKNFAYDICYYLDDVQYTEYDAKSKGFYDWHVDCKLFENEPFTRKLSFVCMLSDDSDYVGGVLELQNPENQDIIKFKLKKNNALVFPSFVKHRVTPVTKGKRISLVSWMEGMPWK